LILYDRNGLFLGMGNQELYLLGYEDIEEFRNYHNDFADLFVNKPGFIFKFTNFSWIEYALHSGTPNKHVLIRTKNGKEVESSLNITEIFLSKEINGSSLFFNVELANAPFKYDIPAVQPILESNEATPVSPSLEASISTSSLNHETLSSEDTPSFLSSPSVIFDSQEASNLESDYTPAHMKADETSYLNIEEDDAIFNIPPPRIRQDDDTNEFKLKLDHTILEDTNHNETSLPLSVPSEYDSIDQIKSIDLHFVDTPLETYPEDNHEDLLKDQTLFVDALKKTPSPLKEDPFDLAECADKLGLDISALAQIMTEYDEALTTFLPKLSDANQTNNDDVSLIEEIQKLKSIAFLLQIDSLYNAFETFEANININMHEEKIQALHELQRTIAAFKEIIL